MQCRIVIILIWSQVHLIKLLIILVELLLVLLRVWTDLVLLLLHLHLLLCIVTVRASIGPHIVSVHYTFFFIHFIRLI